MSLPNPQPGAENSGTATIGRFEIVRQLGKGAQGVVLLANDPQLERQVAIKTLDKRRADHTQLLHEARSVSKLEHPYIIPIYEIGVHDEMPYLVYQYSEGKSLRSILDEQTKFRPFDAVPIISKVLDAIGYAHRSGVVHRDLNPANIMIENGETPRIMDFGISIMMGVGSQSNDVAGTVNYMSPEQVSSNEIGPCVDIFAIGLILHEMLTGQKVFSADNSMAVIYKITNENILPPSARESSVDQKLDELVMQALERDTEKRYGSAAEMKAVLDLYLKPEDNESDSDDAGDDRQGTVKFLLRRMKRKQDFPAISTHISAINKKTSNRNVSSANELANVILKDYALTTKLLRLVNTSFYGQFGGEITTVSRAVVILGFEQVRAAALSIILFEHLSNPSQAKEMKSAAANALMSGIISREQAKTMSRLKDDDVETAFVASMFHKLGKLLAIYYLPEEYNEVRNLVTNKGMKEHQAVLSVLGAQYEDLGKGIAKDWQLPDVIVNSMRKLPDGPIARAKTSDDCISQLSNFSNELCEINTREGNNSQALEELSVRYNKSLGISTKGIKKLMETSAEEITEFTKILNIDPKDLAPLIGKEAAEKAEQAKISTTKKEAAAADTNFSTQRIDRTPIGGGQGADPVSPSDTSGEATEVTGTTEDAPSQTDGDHASSDDTSSIETSRIEGSTNPAEDANQQLLAERNDIIVKGIAEITNTLIDDYNLNEVLTMVLETIYRGMGFTRVLFGIRDPKNNMLLGRFGLGRNIDHIIPNFRGPLGNNDIFTLAVNKNQESVILDVNAFEDKTQIPDWLRQLTMPCCIVLYPIVINKKCIGVIYADTDEDSAQISPDSLKFFNTLRNQATLAIQQQQMR